MAERCFSAIIRPHARPHGRTAIERAEIGRQRDEVLYEIASLRTRIVTARAETLADAAVQLRRRAKKLNHSEQIKPRDA